MGTSADCSGVRRPCRQRPRSARPGPAVLTPAGRRRPVLADIPRSNEGQSLERGPLSLRIGRVADSLDSGRHESVHSSDHGVRPARRPRRRPRALPNVQPRPSRPALHAGIPQFRQRSAIVFLNGKPTCESGRWPKSRRCPTFLGPIHLWSG
jgi:hypothetical protein